MESKQLTDRLEANTALMLELDEKIEKRIIEILSKNGPLITSLVAGSLPFDRNFIGNVARHIAQREANNYNV